MAVVKMFYEDSFGNETTVLRQVGEATIGEQIEIFLEYLKGIGYSVDTISKIDELLSDY